MYLSMYNLKTEYKINIWFWSKISSSNIFSYMLSWLNTVKSLTKLKTVYKDELLQQN